jgi:cobalt/nickel transport system permease protein
MHLPDGLVDGGMALAGYAASAALVGLSLSQVNRLADPGALVPRAALVAAVFFAGSLVSIPVPPTTLHLTLAGFTGVLLGWLAMPVVLIGLFFQAILFGHGGVTTLGLNALIMGLPALLAFAAWRLAGGDSLERPAAMALAGSLGAGGVILAVGLFATIVLMGLPAEIDAAVERQAVGLLILAHLPLAVLEGVVTAAAVGFLHRAGSGLLRHG